MFLLFLIVFCIYSVIYINRCVVFLWGGGGEGKPGCVPTPYG